MVFLPQLHSSRYAAVQSLSLAYLSQQEVLVLKQWFFSTTLYVHERNEYIHTVITRQIYLNKMIVGFHGTSHGPLTADCRINNAPNFTATMTESDIVRASHVCVQAWSYGWARNRCRRTVIFFDYRAHEAITICLFKFDSPVFWQQFSSTTHKVHTTVSA